MRRAGRGCAVRVRSGLGGAGGNLGGGFEERVGGGGGGGLYGGGGGGTSDDTTGTEFGSIGGGGGGSSLAPSDQGTTSLASLATAPIVDITPVPAPTCQPVTSSTPFGQPLTVALTCTEYAGLPLTFATLGAPAHGTVSAVSASGQLTYTPAAGFSGADSFTYDASSVDGVSDVQTVSIVVGTNPVGVAGAGHAGVFGTTARVSASCAGAPDATCSLTAMLTVVETLAGSKLVAVSSARAKPPRRTTKTVTVGAASAVIAAGSTRVAAVALNTAALRLLKSQRALPASLVLTQIVGLTANVISHQTLTFKTHARKRRSRH